MADIIVDGNVKVSWIPTIASTSLVPTLAELTAGTSLELLLTRDGLINFRPETDAVDNSPLGGRADTELPGRLTYKGLKLRFKMQKPTDTMYTTLTLDTVGFVVLRQDVPATTAFAAADQVEVYPVVCGKPSRMEREKNTVSRWEASLFNNGTPNLAAVVTA